MRTATKQLQRTLCVDRRHDSMDFTKKVILVATFVLVAMNIDSLSSTANMLHDHRVAIHNAIVAFVG